MNKVHFLLKNPQKSKNATLIFLHFHYRNEHYKISTGIKVMFSDWNFKKQRIKETAGVIHKEPNRVLDGWEKQFLKAVWMVETGEILQSDIKTVFMGLVNKTEEKPVLSFLDYYKKFNDELKLKKDQATCRPYTMSRNRLMEFQKEGNTVDFNCFNARFYDGLIGFLEGKGYAKNTIGNIVNKMKRVLNQAVRDGLQTDLKFKDYKVPAEDVYNVYLTVDEIRKMYEWKLTGIHDKARDLFVVGCYTGLRVGNYLQLKEMNFKGDFIEVITNKSVGKVTIPIHPYVRAIYNKYEGELPLISEQRLRTHIKEVCILAGIDEPIEWVRTEGGKVVKHCQPKHKMISTHTARRSFATNAYLAGIPVLSIMKITNHKSIKTFMKYIGITDRENAELLAKHQFFN